MTCARSLLPMGEPLDANQVLMRLHESALRFCRQKILIAPASIVSSHLTAASTAAIRPSRPSRTLPFASIIVGLGTLTENFPLRHYHMLPRRFNLEAPCETALRGGCKSSSRGSSSSSNESSGQADKGNNSDDDDDDDCISSSTNSILIIILPLITRRPAGGHKTQTQAPAEVVLVVLVYN